MSEQRLPYGKIYDYVLEKIRTGKIGDKLPSVRELRRQFGFSIVTINKAYQHVISQGLVEVRSGQGCFIKAHEGEVLTEHKNAGFDRSVVMAYKDYFSATTWQVVHEIERLCRIKKFNLLNYKVNSADSLESLVKFIKKQQGVAGILLKGMEDLFYGHLDMLNTLNLPVVLLDSGVENLSEFPNTRSITPDFEQSGFLMAKTLLDHGCQKLAYVQTDTHQFFSIHGLQKSGIKRALREAGLSSRSLLSFMDSAADRNLGAHESGYRLIKQNAAKIKKTDGLIFSNSASAFAALRALAEAGIAVPDDVAVIGEGAYEYTQYTNPPLSTTGFRYSELADKGLDALFNSKTPQLQLLKPYVTVAGSIR
ncbi:MAG: GntR family transcriptional regulator [Kiritimatiellales bacterium]